MGHSLYDPAAQCRQDGRRQTTVGAEATWAVRFFPDRKGRLRDRALFDLRIADLPQPFRETDRELCWIHVGIGVQPISQPDLVRSTAEMANVEQQHLLLSRRSEGLKHV